MAWQVLTGPSLNGQLKPGRFTGSAAKERVREKLDAELRERCKGAGGFFLRMWDHIVLFFWLIFWGSIAATIISEVVKRLF